MERGPSSKFVGDEVLARKGDAPEQPLWPLQMEKLRAALHCRIESVLAPLTRALSRTGLAPNQVTIAGAVTSVFAAALIVIDQFVAAGVVWLLAGLLDLLDGAMARHQGRAGGFGAFIDSTLDRVSEGAIFAAIAYHFAVHGAPVAAALTLCALTGAILVSYTRARAEALGAHCKVGIATRPERILILTFGLWTGLLQPVIYVLLGMTAFTVAQRVWHVHRQLATKR
ncbi:MAG: CDP-alcohol phosphatidyltransferase family protein [Alphaproteobacteria bacterium]|nr:CDP-alcohol phosphatidyltransferase family protein [Alphaproteobacteria bacterium]